MKFSSIPVIFFLFFPTASLLHAETVQQAHTEVELISESSAVRPGQIFSAAVRFKMDPDWHIYWLNPGDSGMTPKIEWRLPDAWTAGLVQWPYPEKMTQVPLATYGYENEVLLMSALQVPETQKPGEMILKATVNWLACKVDCIPGKAELSLPLRVGETAETDTRWIRAFSETRAKLPLNGADWKIEATFSGEKLLIRFWPESGEFFSNLYFFPENPELIRHAAPQVLRTIPQGYELEIFLSANRPRSLEHLRGVLFSSDGWRGPDSEKALSIDLPLNPEPAASSSTATTVPVTFVTAIFFAFLGGLILNLMPCVLPVLSLKILNFVREATENPRELFKHGLAFTAGVLFSFWFLAGLLMIFQAAGRHVGWGFQLQSPSFLVLLTFLFLLFALNLFGVFEIGISLTGLGQPGTVKKGLMGSFSSGIFATVVATPCTAPFMGTALGFSLSQPTWISFLIFTALGLGMAAPYLLLCSQPRLLRFVPKPGAWMIPLKQFLGFSLLATCGWLLWVLSLQRGSGVLPAVLIGLLFACFGAWILGKWTQSLTPKKTRVVAYVLAAFFLIAGIILSFWGLRQRPVEGIKFPVVNSGNKIAWEPYSGKKLETLLREGRPVFIDFTAAWCLTCQVNERVALDNPKVVEAFRQSGVTALKADWTSQDPVITRALSRYGRNSIPLYVLYKAGSDIPILLPELLTPGVVLEFLKRLQQNRIRTSDEPSNQTQAADDV